MPTSSDTRNDSHNAGAETIPPVKPMPPPAGPAHTDRPREIPREQLDHQAPADPDPDDPASP